MSSQPLGEIADIVRGISFPKDAKSLSLREGDVACLRTTNVQRDVEWDDLWFVPAEHVKRPEQFVQPGDILISTANSYELVGKVAPVTAVPKKATLGAFISLIRPRAGVDPRFLYHQLAWGRTQSRIRETASTTTNISNVSTKKLAALELDVPPLDEQRRIVAELEKQFSHLDEAVANLKRVKAHLARQKLAIFVSATSGKLFAKSSAAVDDSKVGERHADLPSGWRWTEIGELADVVRGGSPRPAGDPRYFGGPIPWITVGPITADDDDHLRSVPTGLTEAGRERSRYIEPHTLLLTNSGATLGVPKISLIGGCINDGVAALLNVDYPLKKYLLVYLRSKTTEMRRVNQGAAQPNLNTTIIKRYRVPVPPMDEQHRIVAEVDRRLSIVREVEAEVEANLKRGHVLRQGILSAGFSGSL